MRSTHSLKQVLIVFVLLFFVGSSFSTPVQSDEAKVVINEVLYDPSETDTGNEWIELFNSSCQVVDLTGYSIVAAGDQYILPEINLEPRSFIVVHWRADGENSETDLYTGTGEFDSNMGNTSGSVALFSNSIRSASTIIDFIQWGAGGQSWSTTAVGAGIWLVDDYTVDAEEGSSVGLIMDGDDSNSNSDWGVFTEPSIGLKNSDTTDDPCDTPTQAVTPTPTFMPTLTPTHTPPLTLTPSPSDSVVILVDVLDQIVTENEAVISGSIHNAEAESVYYVKFELLDESGNWYGGKTLGADELTYLSWNASWANYPTITTDSAGFSEYELHVKTKEDMSAGLYSGRIKIRSAATALVTSSGEYAITIVDSTPSLTPTITIQPTVTPLPSPIVTPSVVPTPSPSEDNWNIDFTTLNSFALETPFEVAVSLEGFDSEKSYYVKFEASDSNGDTWYAGKTMGADGVSYLSWNSSWVNYPQVITDTQGNGSIVLSALIKEGVVGTNLLVRIRINPVEGGVIRISGEKETYVTTVESTPIPTNTPQVTPIVSPTQKPTSTPIQDKWLVGFDQETPARIGEAFSVRVDMSGFDPEVNYYVKFDASDNAGDDWYVGRTLSANGETYLSWNSSWVNYPTMTTDTTGSAILSITAMIRLDVNSQSVLGRVRVNPVNGGTIRVTEIKELEIDYALITPSPEISVTPTITPEPVVSPTPSVEVLSILEAKGKMIGLHVNVEGVVTVEHGLLGSEMLYIQDETAGIKVIAQVVDPDVFIVGNKLRVFGELREANNEIYLKLHTMEDVDLLGAVNTIAPLKLTTDQISEENEGSLVEITGRVVQTSGSTFFLDDGSGRVKVFIKDETGIDKPYMRVGYYARVIGVVSQYNDDYRVLPRYQDDVRVSKYQSGLVLGEVSELPDTGSPSNIFSVLSLIMGILFARLNWFLSNMVS